MRVVIALFSAALFLPAAPVVGQSSETDEKETETKTYTSDDLRRAGGARRTAPPSVPANPGNAIASDPASTDDPEEEDAAAAEEAWRQELAEAEAAVAQLEQRITEIELALGNIAQNLHGESRRALTSEAGQKREELIDAKARVEEILQEGYGSGYSR